MSPSRRSLSDLGNFPLTNILSYLSPAHRLSLALTCRSLYAFIVPRILYTSISFPKFTLPSDDVLALRWFRVVKWGSDPALPIDLRINAADASKALRSLELSEAYLHHVFDYDVVYLTRYLRTLIIHGVDSTPPVPHLPRLLSQLTNVSLTFLRHIRLENCKPGELDGLRDLHPLESFAITPKLNSHRYEVGPHTPVGQLLLRSRESLVEVALTNCIWLFDAFDGSTGPQALLWPNVRRLHTALLRPRRQKEPGTPAPPDSLPWPHFPATSSFSLGTSFSSFFLRPENAEFAKNIRHFRGNWRDVRFICQSGAKLEAVWILEKDFPLRWSPGDTFDKELRTLRLVFSLEPKFFSSGSLKKLSALSRHCANITSLTINVYGPHITLFLMKAIIKAISLTHLERLHLSWRIKKKRTKYMEWAGVLRELVYQKFGGSLRYFTISWNDPYPQILAYKKSLGRHWEEISSEEGFDCMVAYDWTWAQETRADRRVEAQWRGERQDYDDLALQPSSSSEHGNGNGNGNEHEYEYESD